MNAYVRILALTAAAAGLVSCGRGGGPADPGFTLDRDAVTITEIQGHGWPPNQNVAVSVTADEVAYLVAAMPDLGPPPAWLSVAIAGTGRSRVLNLALKALQSLPPGTYAATVRVASARADESVIGTRDVAITYQVVPGLAPTGIAQSFVYWLGSSSPLQPGSQRMSVIGTDGLPFTASVDQPWVTLRGASGAVPGEIEVVVEGAGLPVGEHHATVTVLGWREPLTTDVSLFVFDPIWQVSPTPVELLGWAGGDVNTARAWIDLSWQVYQAPFAVTGAPAWLLATPSADLVSSGQAWVDFTADTTSLAPGTYEATVRASFDLGGTVVWRDIPVRLRLRPL